VQCLLFYPSLEKFPPSLKLIQLSPSNAFLLLIRYMTLWPSSFDLDQWSYMTDHAVNPSTKLEDPTAICFDLWVQTSPIGYQCPYCYYVCTISCDIWVGEANFPYIFKILDPNLPIHYTTWKFSTQFEIDTAIHCLVITLYCSLSIRFPFGWLLNKKAAKVEINISLAFLHWVGIALHPTFCLLYSHVSAERGR